MKDPFFGTETQIVPGGAPVNPPYGCKNEGDYRVHQIWEAARKVRDCVYKNIEIVDESPAELLPPSELTKILMGVFCGRRKTLDQYGDPDLELALSEFRQLVPLIDMRQFDDLTSTRSNARPEELKRQIDDFRKGTIDEEYFVKTLRTLAAQGNVHFPENLAPIDAANTLLESLTLAANSGPALDEFDVGSESRVYRSVANNSVYKTLPFRGELMQVKPIEGPEPIETERDAGTFLAGPNGGMPIFDRARLLGLTAGIARTELVGITSGGLAIYKQPYLGDQEPSTKMIEEWSSQYGHSTLPEQEVGPPIMQSANRLPLVTRSPSPGKFVVGMDLNPKNSRVWNGQCIPFDPILRELTPAEINVHPELSAAVAKVKKLISKDKDSPEI